MAMYDNIHEIEPIDVVVAVHAYCYFMMEIDDSMCRSICYHELHRHKISWMCFYGKNYTHLG